MNHQAGVISVKNAWHHPDFSRERAVECLLRAQQSGDSDCVSWMLGSVSHVRNGEGGNGNGGTAAPGRGGGRKRRSSAFSVESNSTIDTSDRRRSSYMELDNEFNYALPSLPISYSSALPDNNRKKRMSWTAGAAAYPTNPLQAHQSWSFGDASSNNAVPSLSSTQSSLLTTGSNRASIPTNKINQSWTVGSGTTPFNPASIQLNQSWTMGVNNLSQIQLSQVLMSPQYDFSASYQPQSSQQQGQGNPSNPPQVGSSSTGYTPQQSSNANSHVNPYEATLSAQVSAQEQVRGQQQQQWGVQNQWQQSQPQQQYQGNEGREAQGVSDSCGGTGGGMSQDDLDLKVFFERFAAQMEEEEKDGEDK